MHVGACMEPGSDVGREGYEFMHNNYYGTLFMKYSIPKNCIQQHAHDMYTLQPCVHIM